MHRNEALFGGLHLRTKRILIFYILLGFETPAPRLVKEKRAPILTLFFYFAASSRITYRSPRRHRRDRLKKQPTPNNASQSGPV